jgi:hypothetical protein
LFWNTAWLKSLDRLSVEAAANASGLPNASAETDSCTEAQVFAATQRPDTGDQVAYVCQATQVPAATEPLPWWQIGQYLEDYTSGNVGIWRMLKSFTFRFYHRLINLGIGLGPTLRWIYDRFQSLHGGTPWPLRRGLVQPGQQAPISKLDLQPGEWVRVKSHQEITATYDSNYKNRGLSFDKEMAPYCGGTYKVLRRVEKLVNEKTGRMQELKTPAIILDSVVCQARYSECRLFCPRAVFPFWREIWLERVEATEVSCGSGLTPASGSDKPEHTSVRPESGSVGG